jgi:hypothetical protein
MASLIVVAFADFLAALVANFASISREGGRPDANRKRGIPRRPLLVNAASQLAPTLSLMYASSILPGGLFPC